MRLEDWQKMSLVERADYEAMRSRMKKIMWVCAGIFGVLFLVTWVALTLHSEGILQ